MIPARFRPMLPYTIILLIAGVAGLVALALTGRPQTGGIAGATGAPAALVSPSRPVNATPTAEATAIATSSATATATVAPTKELPTDTPTPAPTPSFGPITFGTGVQEGTPVDPGLTFPAGTAAIYALWPYEGLAEGTPYRLAWYHDGAPWSDDAYVWDEARYGAEGALFVAPLHPPGDGGLPPGSYRLELFLGERQVQVATFAVQAPTPTPVPSPSPTPDLQMIGRDASRALVMIRVPDDYGYISGGSGAIVSGEQGLILTNWHVVGYRWGELRRQDGLVEIYTLDDLDTRPQPSYRARVLEDYSDADADLALLQITSRLADDTPLQPPLDLPSVSLGDSDQVHRGDRVLALGFPDYAADTVSWTEGTVSTHTGAWIMCDAITSHGHSGGMLLNRQGQLVGVLTGVQQINQTSELSRVRPINLALPLIDAALSGGPAPQVHLPVQEDLGPAHRVVLGTAPLPLHTDPYLESRVLDELAPGTTVEAWSDPEWDGTRLWLYVAVLDSSQMGWLDDAYLALEEAARAPILFTSLQEGSEDIYSISPDGTALTRVTVDPGNERDPAWSPGAARGGGRIVFVSDRDGNAHIYTMDAGGGPWRQLTSGPADDAHPVWSPDATPGAGRIAFASNRDGDWEIYLLALSTGTVRQLTDNDAWDGFPAWSPTGSHLVFVSDRAGDDDLFLVDVETGAETQLTTSPHDETHPAWSPQGDKIAHTITIAEGGRPRHELVLLHISEPDSPWQVVEGVSSQVDRRLPAWSPDGEWLVFVSGRDGNEGLYLVPAAGGPAMKLLDMPGIGTTRPAWSR